MELAQTLPAVPQETFDEHSAVYLRLGQKAVPAIAGVLTDLGGVYQRLGQQTEGLAALEDATDLLRATYGDRDPRFGMTADKYADALVQNGQHQQALPIYRKLLHTMSTSLGVSHPGYQNTLSKLASAATAAGKHAYAAKSYAEMLGYIDNAIEQELGAVMSTETAQAAAVKRMLTTHLRVAARRRRAQKSRPTTQQAFACSMHVR